eukprot:jgi/Ulvmu1/11072/UM007_0254.1
MAICARRPHAALVREAETAVDDQPAWPAAATCTPRRHRRRVAAPFASMNSIDEKAKVPAGTPNPVMDLARKSKKEEAPLPPPPKPPPAWRVVAGNLASGAIAGCVVEAALYPLDTIKTRLQMMRSGGGLSALIKQGGGKALYAGIGGNLLGVAPATAIFMAVYEPAKRAIAAEHTSPQTAFVLSAALAGWAASLVRVPTEVVKQRMQAGEYARPGQAVREIIKRDGLRRGMYAGYGAFLLRDLPFDAIEFWAFDTLNMRLKSMLGREPNPLEHGVCGAIAGAVTGFTTTPLDVLKTRLMTQGSGAARVYDNVWHCALKVYREEGVSAFLRGWQPRVTWIAIGGCIFFTALEQAKKYLVPPTPEDASIAIKH